MEGWNFKNLPTKNLDFSKSTTKIDERLQLIINMVMGEKRPRSLVLQYFIYFLNFYILYNTSQPLGLECNKCIIS